MRRIAWELREQYPTMILQKYNEQTAKNIQKVYDITHNQILIMVDNNDVELEEAKNLQVELKKIESDFFIDSAGTSNEEHGNPVHHGTQKKLRKEGIPCGNHRARKMRREEYVAFDYIICMERYNIQNIMRIIGNDPEHKVQRLLDYTNRPRDIADPWYTGNFDETFDDVMEGCQAFLSYLMEHLQ